ncbi:MAG: hypothetical protein JWQ68_2368 [Cryobacterium sp.]|nr:hypothetical protein [Cryobacterium sp.]
MTFTLMRHRSAGLAAAIEVLRLQRDAPARLLFGRVFGRSTLTHEAEAWYRQATAEIGVGETLARLPTPWTVLHSVPTGIAGHQVDHLVIGPGGILTVVLRHGTGDDISVPDGVLVVDGSARSYLAEAEGVARRVSEVILTRMPLATPVRPVLAFVEPRVITIREKTACVDVVDAGELGGWLQALPPVLGEADARQVVAVLDSPTTWDVTDIGGRVEPIDADPGTCVPADEIMARFRALDADVQAAITARTGWRVAGYAALVVGPIAALPYLLDRVR